MRPPRPCLDCGGEAKGRRCKACQTRVDARHNAAPQRVAYSDPAYQAIPLIGPCVDCGATDDLTRDHRVPLIEGGTNDPSNIVIRCRSCNSAKRERRETSGAGARAYPRLPARTHTER